MSFISFFIIIAAVSALLVNDTSCFSINTLFTVCLQNSTTPKVLAPQCFIELSGAYKCCAVNGDGAVDENNCNWSEGWLRDGCLTDPVLLQTFCRSTNESFLISPECSASSDGSTKCCARLSDGSETTQCTTTPSITAGTLCNVRRSDLTLQCIYPNGTVINTPPQCKSIGDTHTCCAYHVNGTVSRQCYSIS